MSGINKKQIVNFDRDSLLNCFNFNPTTSELHIYLKGTVGSIPCCFELVTKLKEHESSNRDTLVSTVLSIVTSQTLMSDFYARFDNGELFLSTMNEFSFIKDLEFALHSKTLEMGSVIGYYKNNPIYDFIKLKNKVFTYLGIATPKDMQDNRYKTIDKDYIISYNDISYQLI